MKRLLALMLTALSFNACSSGGNILELKGNTFKNCEEIANYLQAASEATQNKNYNDGDETQNVAVPAAQDSSVDFEIGGLEEGDIFKHNENTLVTLAGSTLKIVDISDPARLQLSNTIELGELGINPIDIILGDYLIVIGQNSDFGNKFKTKILVLDVEGAEPQVVHKLGLESRYTTSRVAVQGDRVFIVSSVRKMIDPEREAETVSRVLGRQAILMDEAAPESDKLACECAKVRYLPQDVRIDTDMISTTHIHSLNLSEAQPELTHETSFLGDAPILRATDDAFLLAFGVRSGLEDSVSSSGGVSVSSFSSNGGFWNNSVKAGGTHTYLALSVDESGKLRQTAEGVIEGRVNEQFNLKPGRDVIQVFSSLVPDGFIPEGTVLRTLRRVNGKLEEVAQSNLIGPDEFLFSSLFTNERAFAVTFVKTDPFYIFDLNDPLNPQLKGELKIDGHSRQLRLTKEGNILAIGRDAELLPGGAFALYQGVHVTLFGEDDAGAPILLEREIHGERRTRCDAAGQGWWSIGDQGYKTYLFDRENNILLLPMSMTFEADHGVSVFDLNGSEVNLLGRIENYGSYVDRVSQLENHYLTISSTEIRSHPLNNPTEILSELSL